VLQAQPVEDAVQVVDVIHPDALGLSGSSGQPGSLIGRFMSHLT